MKYFTDNPLERMMMEVPKPVPMRTTPAYLCELNLETRKETTPMRLIICEKPSVAQSIAHALGVWDKKIGYLEGSDLLVSWCIGHLTALASADAYDSRLARWQLSDLPILPKHWKFEVQEDKREQFDLLCGLMNRPDVSEVVNACDAGREGELIFRTVYELAGCAKPILRLWISSMENDAIRDGFRNLRPGSEFDGLYAAALCRSKADWLVGINATRLFSILYHRTLNIGRVLSPTLALLVQREAEIGGFQSEPFYTVQVKGDNFTASGEKTRDKKAAAGIAERCQGKTARVLSVEIKEKTVKPPALFDLTTLQREANRTLGYTAQQTLDYLQSLYEKKLTSYPRTDSRYLTADMEAAVSELVSVAAVLCKRDAPEQMDLAQVCNSGKVSDHHAIVPTMNAKTAELEELPVGERMILKLLSNVLLRAVSGPFRYLEQTAVLECEGQQFTVKGKRVLDMGWRAYLPGETDSSDLPELIEGQELPILSASVKTGRTVPPKQYTEDTLLASMETAGRGELPEDAERRGIGTPATRAAILEKLIATGFAERKTAQKTVHLVPTHQGTSLITILPEALQSPLLTADWEHQLKEIERGELEPEVFMESIAAMLRELVSSAQVVEGAEVLFPSGREAVGKCPRCGRDVTESKMGFFCEGHTCRFALWKDSRFFAAKRKTLTKEIAAELLRGGTVKLTDCWSERTGKTYDCIVGMQDDGDRVRFTTLFDHG